MTSRPRCISPLRYPGGKAPMAPWLSDLFAEQHTGMPLEVWVEPFAGGAGAGLTMLDAGAVSELWLVDANLFDLGFASFNLNRCSRSGIVAPNVGPIGGKAQAGEWTLGSRFNAPQLAERVRNIARMSSGIRVTRGDGIAHIEELVSSGIEDEVMLFVDPPYIREGNRLYANGMDEAGHQRIAPEFAVLSDAVDVGAEPLPLAHRQASLVRELAA